MHNHAAVCIVVSLFFCWGCAYDTAPSPAAATPEDPAFFPSYLEVKAAQERQLATDLQKTLSDFNGVRKVRVHVSLADCRLNAQHEQQSRVAVVAWVENRATVEKAKIRALVAAASVELEPGNVEIILNDAVKDDAQTITPRGHSTYRLILAIVFSALLTGALGIVAVGVRRRMGKSHQSGKTK